jgi:hypothetical protein
LIPITEALQHQLSEHAEARVRQEIARREQVLAGRESSLAEREQSVTLAEGQLEVVVESRVTSARAHMETTIRAAARAEAEGEINELRARASATSEGLKEAQRAELELRIQKRELEEQKATLQLEIARRLDDERAKLRRELERHVRESDQRIATKELALEVREAAVLSAQSDIDARVQERVLVEREHLENAAQTTAAAQFQTQLQDLRLRASEAEERSRDAQEAELRVRSEKRALETQKQALEVDVARRVDAELGRARDEATQAADEQHRLKDAERDRKLQDVLRLNDELRRKVQQGSQQAQGEVLEEALEESLKAQFPLDLFESVPKGVGGGDVVQRVYTRSGQYCGGIVWESKNTKNWSDAWIQKLLDDQRNVKADVAVIVSAATPKEIRGCGDRDGVWITEPRIALGLAMALRTALIQVAVTKRAVASKNESVEVLFAYLTGPEFRQRIEAIGRTFSEMQADLEEEKRVSARRWAKREKHIARVIENTSSMYGDLHGLLGSAMPSAASLEEHDDSHSSLHKPEALSAAAESAAPTRVPPVAT